MNKITLLFFALLLFACESDYSKVIRQERNKNIRNDSLFLGFQMGQTKKDFFNSCWELNKKGLVIQSDDNEYVSKTLLSKDHDNTADDIEMLFYGSFNENNIMTGMDHKFRYLGWSIWNEEYNALKLKEEGMEFSSEVLVRIKQNNFSLHETPINYKIRSGTSKLRTFRDGFRHLWFLLKARWV